MEKETEYPNQAQEQQWLETIRTREDTANIRKINEWLLPLLKSNLINKSLKDITLLSVGCGFGADVDRLVDLQVNACGIEPFTRSWMWHSRRNRGRLIVADGRHVPFKGKAFDIIYCLEVIEHVGGGEKKHIRLNEREKLAKELTRVLKPGGVMIISTPNRHFCIDAGHGMNLFGLRIHSPFDDPTLSFRDIKSLFLEKCGCQDIATLPFRNFITWDLYRKNYPIIRLFHTPLEIYLRLLDRLTFLRSSPLSPHLILAIRK